MSDPLLAITRQDIDDLTRVMSSGWEPPRLNARHVTVPDHTIWTEVVLRDWAEGLRVLDKYHPAITRHPDIWRIALRNSSHKCVEYLWDAMGMDSSRFTEQQRQDCIVGLASAMGEPWSASYEIRDIQPMLEFFSQKGVDLDGVVPGDFEAGDLRLAGHSIFTRALSTRRWDVVVLTWPDPNKDLPSWPRLDEAIMGILDVVGGDYKPLLGNSFISARAGLPAKPFKDLHFKPRNFQQSGVVDDRFLCAWISDFHSQWPQSDPHLVSDLAMPGKSSISAWLRLPVLMESMISPVDEKGLLREIPHELSPQKLREPVWACWKRILEKDGTHTWLRSLVADPLDPEVIKVVELIKSEAPDIIEKFWNAPSSTDGLSSAQVWEMQNRLYEDQFQG